MAYRRPGIRVTQEFVDLVPALAAFQLPSVIIGPAYQVVNADNLGNYDGSASSYPYASLDAGNIVDTSVLDSDELSDHQFPIDVLLSEAQIELIPERETGEVDSNSFLFLDSTVGAFSDVIAGDELEIFERTLEIVGDLFNGSAVVAQPANLVGASPTEFTDVLVGDEITISGGTDVTTGTYTVLTKVDDQNLVLSSSFYVGAGSSSDIEYRIDRTTGTAIQGIYTIREVQDANTLKLRVELASVELPIAYRVRRTVSEIDLERGTHFDADESTVDIFVALQLDGKDIIDGTVLASYRALRINLSSDVREYKDVNDIQAVFGTDQIVPANPLAFGLSVALQNTVTAVNGLGLNEFAQSNETLAHQEALDVLKKTFMYALCPLSQAPVVHQLYATHVTQMSNPDQGKERVAIVNRRIIEEETLIDSVTTDCQKLIINTQTDGIVVLGSNTLVAPSALFQDVQPGDLVDIVAGTGAAVGSYVVDSVDSDVQLTLQGFTATYNGSDISYFVERDCGLEANGQIFTDLNAQFLTEDISPGHFLVITSGAFAGRYAILTVDSETQVTVAQVPGVISVQGGLTYAVEKDLSRLEIAEFLAGYASSFANRRFVVTFPDIVKIPEGSEIRELPGFYMGCAVAALTTGLPTQQGFTNLTVSGFLGFVHGREFFDDDQLDTIASGGVMIFDQEVPEAPLYIRHELTTDMSAIKFQEYMVTKNVDFIAKFMRNAFEGFIGVYNIVDGTFDELKTTAGATISFLRDSTVFPRIGGVIKGGRLAVLEEGSSIDKIAMRFKLDIPIPLNNIDITIQV